MTIVDVLLAEEPLAAEVERLDGEILEPDVFNIIHQVDRYEPAAATVEL
jgi:hypothetical protein